MSPLVSCKLGAGVAPSGHGIYFYERRGSRDKGNFCFIIECRVLIKFSLFARSGPDEPVRESAGSNSRLGPFVLRTIIPRGLGSRGGQATRKSISADPY